MPIPSSLPRSVLRFAFEVTDAAHVAGAWMQEQVELSAAASSTSVSFDQGESLVHAALDWAHQGGFYACLLVYATFVIIGQQAAQRTAFAAALQDSGDAKMAAAAARDPPVTPLLAMLQTQWLSLMLIYVHLFHPGVLDALALHPLFIAVATITLISRMLPADIHSSTSAALLRAHRAWRRWVFILPSDPAQVVLLLLGYALPRVLFPATTGSGMEGWGFDPLETPGHQTPEQMAAAARESAAGAEVCAYSWTLTRGTTPGPQLGSEAAVRVCADVSLLLLVIVGFICPFVEFARLFVLRCSRLHSQPASSSAVATGAPADSSTSATADATAAAGNGDDEDDDSPAPLHHRALSSAHLFALSAAACWMVLTISFVLSAQGAHVRTSEEEGQERSACPVPRESGGSGAYEAEEAMLRAEHDGSGVIGRGLHGLASTDAGCAAFWAQVHSAHQLLSFFLAALATASAWTLRFCPLSLRLPLFSALCLALIKGVYPAGAAAGGQPFLPACVVVATRCMQ